MSDSPVGGVGEVQSTSASTPPVPWQTVELGIAFFGLGRLREWHSSSEDLRVAEFLQSYYVLAGHTIAGAGARLVKLNGAEGLCVIPAAGMAHGVYALCELGAAVRRLAREQRFRYKWIWQAGVVAKSDRNTVVLKLPARGFPAFWWNSESAHSKYNIKSRIGPWHEYSNIKRLR